METLKRVFEDIREVLGMEPGNVELSAFQSAKLLHEFRTFYDKNGDGRLSWKDFELARDYICQKSGWKPKSAKWNACRQLFTDLWRNLLDTADDNTDGEVTADEWLELWTKILKQKCIFERHAKRNPTAKTKQEAEVAGTQEPEKSGCPHEQASPEAESEGFVPKWFESYIEYKFSLLDRAGDGVLDEEEFEYTLSDAFDISPKDCQTAFRLMTKNGEIKMDKAYFRTLALQFYLSNDPSDLGNFINGKLSYD